MYTLILVIASGIAAGVFTFRHDENRVKLVFGAFCGLVAIPFALAAGALIGFLVPMNVVNSDAVALVSMRSSEGIGSAFLLDTRGEEGVSVYHFMSKMEDGTYAPNWVPADESVRIIEESALDGVGFWRTTIRQKSRKSVLYNFGLFKAGYERVMRQEFRVPSGTVVQTFKVQ